MRQRGITTEDYDFSASDDIRLLFHYSAASPGTSNPGISARLTIPRIIHSVVTKVAQSYVTLSCDTDGNNTGGYRFGFNGQEKVNEIAGIGNHTTALFWEYDTRLGRRWNVDPITKEWESGYATNGNNPIKNFDLLGDDFMDKNGKNVTAGDGISANGDGTIITNSGKDRNWDYGSWNEGTGSYDLANYEKTDALSATELLDYGRVDLYASSSARAAGNVSRKAEAKAKGEGSYLRNIIDLKENDLANRNFSCDQ